MQGPEVRTEASLRAARRTTNRQEADSDERAMRVRPKGHAQDARGQLRPKDRVAKPRVHLLTPTSFFLFRSTLYSIPRSATVLVVGLNCGSFVAG